MKNRDMLCEVFFGTLVNPTHVMLIGLFSTLVHTTAVINIQQTREALEGRSVNLVCHVQPFNNNVLVYSYDTISNKKVVFNCKPHGQCYYEGVNCGDCHGTTNATSIVIHIAPLNRSIHQNYWSCNDASMYLTINTAPTELTLEKLLNDTTYSTEQVVLKCSTDCAVPEPNITWYYFENVFNYTYYGFKVSTKSNNDSCENPKQIYSSILTFYGNLAVPEKLGNNVSFHCGIEYFIGNHLWINSTPIALDGYFSVHPTSLIPVCVTSECQTGDGKGTNSHSGTIAGTVCAILTIIMLVVVQEKKTGRISSLLRKPVSKKECVSNKGEARSPVYDYATHPTRFETGPRPDICTSNTEATENDTSISDDDAHELEATQRSLYVNISSSQYKPEIYSTCMPKIYGETVDKKTGKSSYKIPSEMKEMKLFNSDGLLYADLDFENVPIVTGIQTSERKSNSFCSFDVTVYQQIDFKTNGVPLVE